MNAAKRFIIALLCPLLMVASGTVIAKTKKKITTKPDSSLSWQEQINAIIKTGGVYAESESGAPLYALNADTPFIPASTIKVATASAAIDLLGEDYRFPTDFYLDQQQALWIKGYGDPMLTSKELSKIAAALKAQGLETVTAIYLDDSYFTHDIDIPGASASLNPYDASSGALLVNFNTISVKKFKDGRVISAEAETPTTPLTALLASEAPLGESRINLSSHPREAVLYVGHLMKLFLEKEGVVVGNVIEEKTVPSKAPLFYHYDSDHTLSEVLHSLLKYSTNFTANQVYLHMGAKLLSPPAALDKSNQLMREYLKRLGIKEMCIVKEGSGLCRQTAISNRQMVKLLQHFAPHYLLMKERDGAWVKTGTLNGVSALSGYFPSAKHGLVRFSIILNQPGNRRYNVEDLLRQGLSK